MDDTIAELVHIHNTRYFFFSFFCLPFLPLLTREKKGWLTKLGARSGGAHRHRISRLKSEGDELASFGPSKNPNEHSLEDLALDSTSNTEHRDPSGRRTGNPPEQSAADTLRRTLRDAWQACHKDNVSKKVKLTCQLLEDHIDEVRGAVVMAFPQGLPEWDPVRQAIENTEELAGTSVCFILHCTASALLH